MQGDCVSCAFVVAFIIEASNRTLCTFRVWWHPVITVMQICLWIWDNFDNRSLFRRNTDQTECGGLVFFLTHGVCTFLCTGCQTLTGVDIADLRWTESRSWWYSRLWALHYWCCAFGQSGQSYIWVNVCEARLEAGHFLTCSSTQKCSSKEICAVLLSKMCSWQMDNISLKQCKCLVLIKKYFSKLKWQIVV